MAVYSWLSKTAAISALQGRLNQWSLWSPAELWIYLQDSLRHFNGLTEQWNQTVTVPIPTPVPGGGGKWFNTGTLAGSPRLRTVTDVNLYTQMQYMLLEPASGGTWTGSSQFTLQNLQWSLQKRVQEVIQQTSCNIGQLAPINATPGVSTGYALPDNVLEPRRNRFIQAPQFFSPILLTREDVLSFQSFEPGYLQEQGSPQSWSVSSEPPLSFDVDIAPNTPGYFELLALVSGPTFAPPTASLLGVPDDWSMVAMYGALADVLGQEAESTDRARAAYCLERYTAMLEMMKQSNWLLQTLINGKAVPITSLAEMDALAVNWQESQDNLPTVVEAGMDFITPVPNSGDSLSITMVGNAPLLDSTGNYVQCARDDWDAILNLAHHTSMFKCGNEEFEATMPMLKAFYQFCADRNKRWLTQGVFIRYLRSEGRLQDKAAPRWATQETQ